MLQTFVRAPDVCCDCRHDRLRSDHKPSCTHGGQGSLPPAHTGCMLKSLEHLVEDGLRKHQVLMWVFDTPKPFEGACVIAACLPAAASCTCEVTSTECKNKALPQNLYL